MTDTHSELKNIIEAALLVAGQPLTLDKLLSLFPEDSRPGRDEVRAALKQLETDYEQRGIELRQIDQGYRFQSREKYAEWIARLSEERPVRYSRALLETLAIIAYRQPVTRGEIEDIRGVAVSSEIIKTLVGRDWVRQVGTRDVPGRPALYGTTRGFLEHFNLKGLDALPPLVELRDIDRIAAELNMSLPMDDAGPTTEGENPEMDAAPSDNTPAQSTAEGVVALQAGADDESMDGRGSPRREPAVDAGSPAAKL